MAAPKKELSRLLEAIGKKIAFGDYPIREPELMELTNKARSLALKMSVNRWMVGVSGSDTLDELRPLDQDQAEVEELMTTIYAEARTLIDVRKTLQRFQEQYPDTEIAYETILLPESVQDRLYEVIKAGRDYSIPLHEEIAAVLIAGIEALEERQNEEAAD